MTDPQSESDQIIPADAPRRYVLADVWAKVGRLLFYWSSLELALTEAILCARKRLNLPNVASTGAISTRLDAWHELAVELPENRARADIAGKIRAQANELRNIRNLIVHGLRGGSAHPEKGTPRITCAVGGYDKPTGEEVEYTIDDLEHFTQGIDACARSFMHLEAFNYPIDFSVLPKPFFPPKNTPIATSEP